MPDTILQFTGATNVSEKETMRRRILFTAALELTLPFVVESHKDKITTLLTRYPELAVDVAMKFLCLHKNVMQS